jgi:hypothetical protein
MRFLRLSFPAIPRRFFWIIGLLCFFAFNAAAQTTSTITGTTKDTNGAVLVGVQVSAKQLDTGLTRTTTSADEGRFVFPGLPIGLYELRAEANGFEPLVFPDVRLTVNETTAVTLVLKVSSVTAGVTVKSGDEALVNTQTAELSYLVNEQSIRGLPLNGRNYTDLALLQPGVIAYPHRDGGSVVAHGLAMSINGQDPRSNVYLLDGTPQNDFTNGPAGSAASTVLGVETIREFRVEANSYGAEFGRNAGGQINVVSKSGSNEYHGSLYEFHRNDNFDARNFFDVGRTPEFKRNQFGGSLGGPIKIDRTFFFFGYESLREQLGQSIRTVVPDLDARQGVITSCAITPSAGQPCPAASIIRTTVGVNAAVRPYLDEFPLPNVGPSNVVGNLAVFTFGFNRQITEHFTQGRIDRNWSDRQQSFARYTFDDADQHLPTDFPQFPRAFRSRNQFFTAEHRLLQSANTIHSFRFNFARTRVGQAVESHTTQTLQPFIPGRDSIGNIDIGGMPRFGPQTSVSVKLTQNVFGGEYGAIHTHGRHLIKAGGLVEYYQDNMVNPTFSLGIWTFANVSNFLRNVPQSFLGLTPNGALDRYWRFTLFAGYVQDTFRVHPRLTLNAGVRYETTTMPVDLYGRDSALPSLTDRAPTVGPLYENPTRKNISPRLGFAWDVFGDGRTSVRGGYGIYFNTNNQQNLIVTVTNPPATPRIAVAISPTCPTTFPAAPLACPFANSIRPVQFDLDNPYVNVYNLSVQRELPWDTVVTLGYAGSRGVHLLRSNDVNTAVSVIQPDGTPFYPVGSPRQNTAFSTIELKSSDGDSWYNAMVFEVRKRWSHNFNFQSSYTFSRNIDTTQASTFFSDATNGTTTAFPEFPGFNYNKGLADYHAKHNWLVNFTWEIPFARKLDGVAKTLLDGWQLAGISNARSGNPLTVFVQANRSRSLWQPSLGPGIGRDRASMAPGFTYDTAVLGGPDQYFNPLAFAIPAAGTLGNTGRGAFIGPNYRSFDLAAVKNTRIPRLLGESGSLQIRAEAFNLFNRANFGPPALTVFAGAANVEPALTTFGRIRSTVGSSRQIQLGVRIAF